MCELFGVSTETKIRINSYLDTFFKRSVEHHNGWGLALLDEGSSSVEKEPLRAVDSQYLKNRLTGNIDTSACIAHIRKATIGDVSFSNTHPFSLTDDSGRRWILVHNGTIFDSPLLSPYLHEQAGTTDSERILYYIVDSVNSSCPESLTEQDRHELIGRIIRDITPENKVNILLYDGEDLYVHKNEASTLYKCIIPEGAVFATQPLDDAIWEEIPQNTLQVYKSGQLVYQGTPHANTYVHNDEKMKLIYLDHAVL